MTVILIDILAIKNAQKNIQEIVIRSPFIKNLNYSNKFKANIFFKSKNTLFDSYILSGYGLSIRGSTFSPALKCGR